MTIEKAEKWYTTKEAGSYLRISPNALRIRVHRGEIKSYKLGARLRFKQSDLESLLEKKENDYVSENVLS